ncbi:MAG: hypothetical protein WDA29_09990 [Flavobacteriaceae bacterium]
MSKGRKRQPPPNSFRIDLVTVNQEIISLRDIDNDIVVITEMSAREIAELNAKSIAETLETDGWIQVWDSKHTKMIEQVPILRLVKSTKTT